MTARDSQATGRLRLRHLLEVTEARGEEIAAERPRFERLSSDQARPRVVSAFNLFQTPEALARQVAELLPEQLGRTLEPSAGLGRLYHALRARDQAAPITLVDNAPDCCAELYRMTEADGLARLIQADFLACDRDRLGEFDSILMNPPFKNGTDIKHILHARTFLAAGGRLVSICAAGPRQLAKLRPIATEWHDLPAGSFKEAATNVSAAIAIFDA
jgi:predicted RNA methylase